jgi:hypothetical protein
MTTRRKSPKKPESFAADVSRFNNRTSGMSMDVRLQPPLLGIQNGGNFIRILKVSSESVS